ncbi:MAG: carboxymuconolactone decarboxylase family protein [Woeseia sp.]
MTTLNIHSKETARPESAGLLGEAEKAYGFIPNLLGVFAESPAVLKAYLTIGSIFDESSFSPTERQVVILAASRFNECHYCMAAHSVAADMQGVPADVVEAIRNDQQIADNRLEALRNFTTAVVEKRGWVSDDDIAAFVGAGYSKAQVLEVVLGVSFKTISNYTNHIADTPVDDAFATRAWQPVRQQLAG